MNKTTKNTVKLFKAIDVKIMNKALRMLDTARLKHPPYRDDELLLWLLCKKLAVKV